jgi:hypothetical protein
VAGLSTGFKGSFAGIECVGPIALLLFPRGRPNRSHFCKIDSENESIESAACDLHRKQMIYSQIVSEISYSRSLEVTFEFILRNSSISNSRETPSFQFITAARFLKNNAPHLFQIREMGAKSENRMDRWLWDLLKE